MRPTPRPTIVIGTKNFAEEYILGQLYKQALEAKGFKVSYKENIGSTEIIQTALTSGKINFYPEYTGVIVQVVFHHALVGRRRRQATYQLAKKLEAKKGYHAPQADAVLRHRRARGDERDGEEVRAEVDRRPEEGRQLQARRLPGVQDAQHLLPRLHEAVRAHERDVRRRSPASRPYAALDSGKVLAADVFSTDPPLGKPSKYTVLADPKHVTGFQNVAPIVEDVGAQGGRPDVHEDGERGLGQADHCRRSSP